MYECMYGNRYNLFEKYFSITIRAVNDLYLFPYRQITKGDETHCSNCFICEREKIDFNDTELSGRALYRIQHTHKHTYIFIYIYA